MLWCQRQPCLSWLTSMGDVTWQHCAEQHSGCFEETLQIEQVNVVGRVDVGTLSACPSVPFSVILRSSLFYILLIKILEHHFPVTVVFRRGFSVQRNFSDLFILVCVTLQQSYQVLSFEQQINCRNNQPFIYYVVILFLCHFSFILSK